MYYMMTSGRTQIERAYIGRTAMDALKRAATEFSKAPNYNPFSARGILEMLVRDQCGLMDLVMIKESWPREGQINVEEARKVYESSRIIARDAWEEEYGTEIVWEDICYRQQIPNHNSSLKLGGVLNYFKGWPIT